MTDRTSTSWLDRVPTLLTAAVRRVRCHARGMIEGPATIFDGATAEVHAANWLRKPGPDGCPRLQIDCTVHVRHRPDGIDPSWNPQYLRLLAAAPAADADRATPAPTAPASATDGAAAAPAAPTVWTDRGATAPTTTGPTTTAPTTTGPTTTGPTTTAPTTTASRDETRRNDTRHNDTRHNDAPGADAPGADAPGGRAPLAYARGAAAPAGADRTPPDAAATDPEFDSPVPQATVGVALSLRPDGTTGHTAWSARGPARLRIVFHCPDDLGTPVRLAYLSDEVVLCRLDVPPPPPQKCGG